MQCAPAFNYALHSHETFIVDDDSLPSTAQPQKKAVFVSRDLTLDLRYVAEQTPDGTLPEVTLEFLDLAAKGHKGLAVQSNIRLEEGQCVTFVLRNPPARTIPLPSQKEAAATAVQNLQERAPSASDSKEWRLTAETAPRAVDDPLLTKELLGALLQVRVFPACDNVCFC